MDDLFTASDDPLRKRYAEPYTAHNPIPTVSGYRNELSSRPTSSTSSSTIDRSPPGPGKVYYGEAPPPPPPPHEDIDHVAPQYDENRSPGAAAAQSVIEDNNTSVQSAPPPAPDPSSSSSPNEKNKRHQREVTDPVTHLTITIHDSTIKELEQIPPPTPSGSIDGEKQRKGSKSQDKTSSSSSTGTSTSEKIKDSEQRHGEMQALLDQETSGWVADSESTWKREVYFVDLVAAVAAGLAAWMVFLGMAWGRFGVLEVGIGSVGCGVLGVVVGVCVCVVVGGGKFGRILQQEPPATHPTHSSPDHRTQTPESASWLNSILHSVWPLVNPDLFMSLADMLEDVMQASLPRMVKMIRVADLGQGSEPVRFLGIRWLRDGEAGEEKEGLVAEEGDFVNLEVAFAYRSRPSGKGLKSKTKNAHLLVYFYLAGGLPFPIWVELKGAIGTARLRFQLTPDPPFFSFLTLTLLGQPKVTLSCVPLAKKFPNLMDLPIISSFVQSSIDAAMNQYVAPRSLTLDLKEMLMGDDFKKDTNAVGVVLICIRSARGFKDGDGTKGLLGKAVGKNMGGGDAYVTVGWSKFGKPLWSTRVIKSDPEPNWMETTFVLVGPEELNAGERLRLQLWDSDRATADDHLGSDEVDLKELMTNEQTKGNISAREDGLNGIGGDPMPGKLFWDVGYFAKTKLLPSQIQPKSGAEPSESSNPKKLESNVNSEAARKLREATNKDETRELEQQKKEDLKEQSDGMIAHSPPSEEFPSGVLSVQIHQVTGLEIEQNGIGRKQNVNDDNEEEEGDDLPSSYCTVILNHTKIFKTRTKPKSSKPFFNAGTERFIRDWKTTEIIISARDSRTHENDALLGVVVLPLKTIFKERSQINSTFPLVGGIAHGRMRISMVFRSVEAKLPPNLLGWDIGTLEIQPWAITTGSPDPPEEIKSCHLVLRTPYSKGKMIPSSSPPPSSADASGSWRQKRDRPIHLPVKRRYASYLIIEFRKRSFGLDSTSAFSVIWLKDIPDEPHSGGGVTLTLPIWRETKSSSITTAEKSADLTYPDNLLLGNLQLRICFWQGLSGYHKKLSTKDSNMADVMESLDCAEDAKETRGSTVLPQDGSTSFSSSSSSSSSSSDDEEERKLGETGKRNPLDDVREYKKNKKVLHRHHRGLMQWKGVRTLAWMKNEVKDTGGAIGEKVARPWSKHREKKDRVETEV